MSCDAPSLGFHRCKPEPPKLKFETALELLDIQLDRLKDEAFWCAATTSAAPASTPALQHAATYLTPRPSMLSALGVGSGLGSAEPSPDPNLRPEQGGGVADQAAVRRQ